MNLILANDSYKLSHKDQLPPGTTKIYSHLTPRFLHYLKADYPGLKDELVVYGLQSTIQILIENWTEHFFKKSWNDIELETLKVLTPFIGWTSNELLHFKELHELGYLPLEFKIIPEGTVIPVNYPVMTIQNTHDSFAWMTNFVESSLLNEVFKPLTVATIGRQFAKLRDKYFDLTVSDQSGKDFALHDFSYRGHSGHASASHTISAYLLYTKGTDTMSAVEFAQKYYQAVSDIAGSIPALEHSTASLGIHTYKNVLNTSSHTEVGVSYETYKLGIQAARVVRNKLMSMEASLKDIQLAVGETFNLVRLLLEVYPSGLFAYVADTYNYYRLISVIIPAIKDIILSRNGKLILRPDSGNPVDVLCGHAILKTSEDSVKDWLRYNTAIHSKDICINLSDNSYHIQQENLGFVQISEVEAKGSVEVLWEIFGGTINDKGFKELDPHIGLVYGDGINYCRAEGIYQGLMNKGFASNNACLALGAYTLAHLSRDHLGLALKASYALVNGESISIYKEPATDTSKASKSGLFKVEKTESGFEMYSGVTPEEEAQGLFKTICKDSVLTNLNTFDEIKAVLN